MISSYMFSILFEDNKPIITIIYTPKLQFFSILSKQSYSIQYFLNYLNKLKFFF